MSEPTPSSPQQPDIVQNVNSQDDGKTKKTVSTQTGQVAGQNETKPSPSLLDMTSVNSMEKNFQEVVMGKMFKDLESKMAETTRRLDEMNQKFEQERKQQEKERLTEHIPGPLKNQGQSLMDVLRSIDQHLMYCNYDPDVDRSSLRRARLQRLDERGYAALLAHSVGAWMGTFEAEHRERLANRFYADASMWISRIWRFPDSSVYFHGEAMESVLFVCRMALREKFPKYSTEGFQALFSRPPVIYLSSAAKSGLADYLQFRLGLPASCICVLPSSEMDVHHQTIDLNAFEQLLLSDMSVGKTPLLLMAFAGTHLTGDTDNLTRLSEICKKNRMWLHIEGQKLAQIALLSVPTSVQDVKSKVHSMTLDLSSWLGVPAIPYVTLFKGESGEISFTSFEALGNPMPLATKLSILPLWVTLQVMGHDGIVERIKTAGKLVTLFKKHLKNLPNIRIVKKAVQKKESTIEIEGVRNLVGTILSSLLTYEIPSAVVLFRYTLNVEEKPVDVSRSVAPYAKNKTPPSTKNVMAPYANTDTAITADKSPDEEEASEAVSASKLNEPYFDALNQWLCETLSEAFPHFGIQTASVNGEGVCIRFCPIENLQMEDEKPKEMEQFFKHLKKNLSIVDATVNEREPFWEVIAAQDQLELVQLPDWAGLGAVRYLPTGFGPDETDSLNLELLEHLRAEDSAFSLGREPSGRPCLRFGLITRDTDVEELAGMVLAAGRICEQESKFLDSMTERVKAGIEKAQSDLRREHQRQLAEEGVLRQVPFLDSIMNWWSPIGEEAKPRGRALLLDSGEIMSTEDTYKYRMQIVSPPRRSEGSVGDSSPKEVLKKGSHKTLLKPRRGSTSSSVASATRGVEKDLLEPVNGDGPPNHQRQTSTASRITIDSAEEPSLS